MHLACMQVCTCCTAFHVHSDSGVSSVGSNECRRVPESEGMKQLLGSIVPLKLCFSLHATHTFQEDDSPAIVGTEGEAWNRTTKMRCNVITSAASGGPQPPRDPSCGGPAPSRQAFPRATGERIKCGMAQQCGSQPPSPPSALSYLCACLTAGDTRCSSHWRRPWQSPPPSWTHSGARQACGGR
jgi:hypothetical protein